MQRAKFHEFCLSRLIILDGATGTELQKRGLPVGGCPEKWAVEHPEILGDIAASYRAAGSDIVYACSFGGNRAKLEEFALADQIVEINSAAVKIAKNAVGKTGLVAGDLAPTGKIIEPYGDFPFNSAIEIFREQAGILITAGADLIVIETMLDIQEARAALIAVREIAPEIPVLVTMTFSDTGQTLTGTPPLAALITLQSLGADAFGFNCSVGPAEMARWLRAVKPYSTIPLIAKPNAGAPKIIDGKTVFPMPPDEYASYFPLLAAAGANIIGGCCGSSPAHLTAVANAVKNHALLPPPRKSISAASSMRETVFIGGDAPFCIIGERINPTGKKKFAEELREGKLTTARQFALEQTQNGAHLLDINVGAANVNEVTMLAEITKIVSSISSCPLCLDSANPAAMEAALRIYPGRAVLNSVSAENVRLEKMLPLARKYGAMIVVLPVTDSGVPEDLGSRQKVALEIITAAEKTGLTRADLIIDGIVLTVSSAPNAPQITADFIEWCARDLQMATSVGLSNVSFGMPAREQLNLAFLGMLISRGLNAALVNPSFTAMGDLIAATDTLRARDQNFARYLKRFSAPPPVSSAAGKNNLSPREIIYHCVLNGDTDNIATVLQNGLLAGEAANDLLNQVLFPAINQVGEWFEKKIYFLPQLMMSAAALSAGCKFLEPHLANDATTRDLKLKIVIATVKGDIHDIGKNIVALLLRNHGFTVIDLGKDVDEKTIVETALAEKISLVGLSALMTTTMVEMPKVIAYAKNNGGGHLQFMIGGAAVDQNFADSIGAHYSTDAIAAVKLAKRLLDK